jgi:hypothetical protein
MTTPSPIVWDRAEDCIVIDVDGHEFIDFSSGVLVPTQVTAKKSSRSASYAAVSQ